jgi:hypothetical protein
MRATQVVSTGNDGSRAFNLLSGTRRELGGPHSRAMTTEVWWWETLALGGANLLDKVTP